jgi:uncharacterized protein YdeI (YjbR/CyaY-like superfamily)
MTAKPRYFANPAAFRAWLQKNHARAAELHVGYFKRHTAKPSMTWPESVAEALCFGWIDGIRRSIDEERYMIRFTPRRSTSIWSAINIRMVAELDKAGKMTPAGRKAFAARKEAKSKVYSFEQQDRSAVKLAPSLLQKLKKHKAAWKQFESAPPSYRKKVIWWIMSAKAEATRDRRFQQLFDACVAQQRLT